MHARQLFKYINQQMLRKKNLGNVKESLLSQGRNGPDVNPVFLEPKLDQSPVPSLQPNANIRAPGIHPLPKLKIMSLALLSLLLIFIFVLINYKFFQKNNSSQSKTNNRPSTQQDGPFPLENRALKFEVDKAGGSASLFIKAGSFIGSSDQKVVGVSWMPEEKEFIGSEYYITPLDLKLSIPATLTIRFTKESLSLHPLDKIRLYRWEDRGEGFGWRTIRSDISLIDYTATAQINALGSYALMVDENPPEIQLDSPTQNEIFSQYLVNLDGAIHDSGVGADKLKFVVKIDESLLPVKLNNSGGFQYFFSKQPEVGQHTIDISVSDYNGNSTSKRIGFSVEPFNEK
jgi:hypothetical protein